MIAYLSCDLLHAQLDDRTCVNKNICVAEPKEGTNLTDLIAYNEKNNNTIQFYNNNMCNPSLHPLVFGLCMLHALILYVAAYRIMLYYTSVKNISLKC